MSSRPGQRLPRFRDDVPKEPPSSRKSRSDCPGPVIQERPEALSGTRRACRSYSLPLDAREIEGGISPEIRRMITGLDVLEGTDSTNDELLRLPSAERHGRIVLAERQSAGKGRRGRTWHSPGGNIFLSVGWRFRTSRHSLGDLPHVVAVCICRALAGIGLRGHRVKRPNDILVDGAKLCGILVETRGGRTGCDSVTGIGVNVRLDDEARRRIDQPSTDLQSLLGDELPPRNAVVSSILAELLPRFENEPRMAAFLADAWPEWKLPGDQP